MAQYELSCHKTNHEPLDCQFLKPRMFTHSFNPNPVRPLATAENQFLQVLVDRFSIRRNGSGFELQVAFSEESPAI